MLNIAPTIAFDFATLTGRERYKLLIGAVVPRPIALVTTVDGEGRVNAAPFSFFNCLSADPAILALGVEFRPTGPQKDTGRNVRDTQCFTVNIVSDAILEAMNICAVPFEPGIDELAEAGLTAAPGVKVACPWIAEAPAAFECRHHTTLGIGKTRRSSWVRCFMRTSAPTWWISQALCRSGRARRGGPHGGQGYASTRDYFDLPTMTVDGWRSSGMPLRTRPAEATSKRPT